MVIERYLSGPGPVYQRAAACGRMLPEGLVYVSSWVVDDGGMDQCFQLMETSDPALFDAWFERWNDLVSFQVYPVITSAEAATRTGTAPEQALWRFGSVLSGRRVAARGPLSGADAVHRWASRTPRWPRCQRGVGITSRGES
jgi:hypothetical protein